MVSPAGVRCSRGKLLLGFGSVEIILMQYHRARKDVAQQPCKRGFSAGRAPTDGNYDGLPVIHCGSGPPAAREVGLQRAGACEDGGGPEENLQNEMGDRC